MPKIRVLLVDDSGFMRIVLADIINSQPDIEVIDTASDGKEAFDKTILHNPDVILLDLTMKEYDGLYAITHIMKKKPTPIVILSSIRTTQPDAVMQALEAGAYDFIDKPTGLIGSKVREIENKICDSIRQADKADPSNLLVKKHHNTFNHTFDTQFQYGIVAIGASTGGTGALELLLTNLPGNFPLPIVIAQHMPKEFIETFAARLDELIPLKVKVAREHEILQPKTVYFLPGNTNTGIMKKANEAVFYTTEDRFSEFNNPSADCLMASVANVYSQKAIGIILTGMGKDGAKGLKNIYDKGGYTLAQDEASSVVWGMPKAAFDTGGVRMLMPLQQMSGFIVSCLS